MVKAIVALQCTCAVCVYMCCLQQNHFNNHNYPHISIQCAMFAPCSRCLYDECNDRLRVQCVFVLLATESLQQQQQPQSRTFFSCLYDECNDRLRVQCVCVRVLLATESLQQQPQLSTYLDTQMLVTQFESHSDIPTSGPRFIARVGAALLNLFLLMREMAGFTCVQCERAHIPKANIYTMRPARACALKNYCDVCVCVCVCVQ